MGAFDIHPTYNTTTPGELMQSVLDFEHTRQQQQTTFTIAIIVGFVVLALVGYLSVAISKRRKTIAKAAEEVAISSAVVAVKSKRAIQGRMSAFKQKVQKRLDEKP